MGRILSIKQKRFIQELPTSKSSKEAALKAGYSPNTARFIASENLTKPNIQREIVRVLDQAGLDDSKLATRLSKAIDSGLTQKANNADSLRGLEMAFKLRDRFPVDKRVEAKIDIKAELNKKSIKELKEELLRLRAEEEKFL